ncbi:protein-L-isoaspartate(D-aspartate) O-methyltransferase [Lysobacter sp. D1-1-M9]|uniref:protein-L-isoaspartate(D-aspartate) O-methyltransferase n=1 Tax=Novilysobacter longmucuonensis TaxID=3098603 RepID=UPI002FC8CDA5
MNATEQREQMVEFQIARRGLDDRHLLQAMRVVPRERFVPDEVREYAYEDSALPIEGGQTISQPYIVALMIDAARLAPGERVLEIGTGSGYAAAVMGAIAQQVYTIERLPELAALARQRFAELGYDNIEVRTDDGTGGWPEQAPFDAILAAAGGPRVPELLREQLVIGGRLVMPVGDRSGAQRLVKVTRGEHGRYQQVDLGGVMFVPLIGTYGWDDAPAPPARGGTPWT